MPNYKGLSNSAENKISEIESYFANLEEQARVKKTTMAFRSGQNIRQPELRDEISKRSPHDSFEIRAIST